jgi:hypothetical protein
MDQILSVAIGAVGAGALYFVYLAASKGLPATVAWAKAKWNAGKTEAAALRADFDQLEQGALGRISTLEADVAKLKGYLGPAATAPNPAPAAAAPTAAAQPSPPVVTSATVAGAPSPEPAAPTASA